MTEKEFAQWAMAAQGYYPKEDRFLANDYMMDLWFQQLKDLDYKIAEAALNKWVATNRWSPTIADIREIATTFCLGELPDWGAAWDEVLIAIRRYGTYRAFEAVESLSPITQKTVKRLGYLELCRSDNLTADRANFRDIYNTLASREKENAQLPEHIRDLISQMPQARLEG